MRRVGRRIAVVGLLALALVEPSIPPLMKFGGPWLAAADIAAILLAAGLLPELAAWLRARIGPRGADLLAAALVLLVAVAIVVVYPRANVHLPGHGSDRDDALVVATSALLRGVHPYREPTYLHNPITPLPGALLLAVPFVLAGAIALQSVLWLGVLYVVMRQWTRDPHLALALLGMAVVSAGPLHEMLIGGDLFTNGIYVAVACVILDVVAGRAGTGRGHLAAAALGVTLASRFTFVYLVPLVCASLATQVGWRRAFALSATTVTTFLLLTLPLYLADPAAFAPLHMRAKLAVFRQTLPHPDLVVPALTVVAALAACLPFERVRQSFHARALFVVGFPTFVLLALALVTPGKLLREYLSMALSFSAFGMLAAASMVSAQASARCATRDE